MQATRIYHQLEEDFITPEMRDEWAEDMKAVSDFLSPNFMQRSMGLVCDFAVEIQKVYTAVFPSADVMQKILDDGTQDGMLFVHHPMIWDIRKAPEVFQQMDRALLQKFLERRISIYNLHVPLDHFGKYSTSVILAKALGIRPTTAFAPYFGAMAGIFGKCDYATVRDLKHKFQETVSHEVRLYNYGDCEIKNAMVAVVAGGGNDIEVLEEISNAGINTFVTGIALKNEFSSAAHAYAEKQRINVLGGTHYSTEKFACMAMVHYFADIGLPAVFIEGEPVMEDM